MNDDDYGRLIEQTPHSYRHRDRFVLPMWAWPIIGIVCLLLGMVLGWFLWRFTSNAPVVAPPTTTVVAAAPTLTTTPLSLATATLAPTLTPLPQSTATATSLPPTATATLAPTQRPTAGKIAVGGRVKVVGTEKAGLRLRSGPGLNFITFKTVDEGKVLEVLGGPETADNLTWWRLRDDKDVIGWGADTYLVPE